MPPTDADISDLKVRLTLLEDEREIRRCLERYGHSLDYGLESEWVDCFVADGVYELQPRIPSDAFAKGYPNAEFRKGNVRFVGHKMLATFPAAHTRAPAQYHKHVVVDPVITRDGDADTARCTSYFQRLDEFGGRIFVTAFGRYVDRLTRCADGRWRFLERLVELESVAYEPG